MDITFLMEIWFKIKQPIGDVMINVSVDFLSLSEG